MHQAAQVQRFKSAYPSWNRLSWQKSTQIQLDIRCLKAFSYLIQFFEKPTQLKYSFKKDLILIFEQIYERKLQQYVAKERYDRVHEVFVPQSSQQEFKNDIWKELRANLTGEEQEEVIQLQEIRDQREEESWSSNITLENFTSLALILLNAVILIKRIS